MKEDHLRFQKVFLSYLRNNIYCLQRHFIILCPYCLELDKYAADCAAHGNFKVVPYIHGNLWRGKQEILIKTSARQMAVWVHNHVLQSLIF
jgi:hypothetical protein